MNDAPRSENKRPPHDRAKIFALIVGVIVAMTAVRIAAIIKGYNEVKVNALRAEQQDAQLHQMAEHKHAGPDAKAPAKP